MPSRVFPACVALAFFAIGCSRSPTPSPTPPAVPAKTNHTAAATTILELPPGDVAWSQLPPAIQAAATVNPDDIHRIEKQVEEGNVRIVIQARRGGVEKTVTAHLAGAPPAAENLIPWSRLPAPVQSALGEHIAPTDLRRAERIEDEAGAVKFTIQAVVRGLEHTFTLKPDGSPLPASATLSWNELPKEIRPAFEKALNPTDLRKIEKVVAEGSTNFIADLHPHGLQSILTLSDPAVADHIVCWNEIPKPVQAALQKELKPGDVLKIERVPGEGVTNHVAEAFVGGVRKTVTFSKPIPAGAPDNMVSWNSLPKSVQTILQKDLKPGDLQKIEFEEDSRYVAYTFANGVGKIVTVPVTGLLARADTVIAWNEVPKPVQAAFQKAAKPGEIHRIEKIPDAEGRAIYTAHKRVGALHAALSAGAGGEMTFADSLVAWNDLPKAVQAALQKEVQPGDTRAIEKPADGGAPIYAVTVASDGCERVVRLGLYGELPQADSVVAWNQLPPAVQERAGKETAAADIRKIERPSEGSPCYLFSATANGLDQAIAVSPAGAILPADNLVSWNQLPPAVRDALRKEASPRDLRRIERSGEEPDILYTAQGVDGRHVNTMTLSADGKMVSVERELAWEKLPASIQASVQEQAKPSSVTRIRALRAQDVPPTYQVRAMFSGVEKTILLSEDGKLLGIEPVAE